MNNSSSDGYYTIARPKICSKDCISCHREMMGIEDEQYQFSFFNSNNCLIEIDEIIDLK